MPFFFVDCLFSGNGRRLEKGQFLFNERAGGDEHPRPLLQGALHLLEQVSGDALQSSVLLGTSTLLDGCPGKASTLLKKKHNLFVRKSASNLNSKMRNLIFLVRSCLL